MFSRYSDVDIFRFHFPDFDLDTSLHAPNSVVRTVSRVHVDTSRLIQIYYPHAPASGSGLLVDHVRFRSVFSILQRGREDPPDRVEIVQDRQDHRVLLRPKGDVLDVDAIQRRLRFETHVDQTQTEIRHEARHGEAR